MAEGLGSGAMCLAAVIVLVVLGVAVAKAFRAPPMVREQRRRQREWDRWGRSELSRRHADLILEAVARKAQMDREPWPSRDDAEHGQYADRDFDGLDG